MFVQHFKQRQPRKADRHLPKIKQESTMNGLFGWRQALTRTSSYIISSPYMGNDNDIVQIFMQK
jgi:hypothetical protein